jgi:uroporphyrinogen III methyltransferase/synthase
VVGEVAGMREAINWFEHRPLFGKRILLTRSWPRQKSAVGRYMGSLIDTGLRELGAHVVEVPAIRIEPLPSGPIIDRIREIRGFTDLIFTSGNAVDVFLDAVDECGMTPREIARVHISVMGTGTAANRG